MSKDIKTQINAALSEWEEQMIADLAKQYSLSDTTVLNIGVTFLINELSASANGKPSLLNSMHPSDPSKNDTESKEQPKDSDHIV